MIQRLLTAFVVLAIAAPVVADEKFDAKKLKGTWAREVDGTKLAYEFKDEKKMIVHLTPAGADKAVKVECDYSIDKEHVLHGVIAKVEAEGADGLPAVGDKFSFKIEVGKETLVASDFKGAEGDQVKKLIEGEYKKKTD